MEDYRAKNIPIATSTPNLLQNTISERQHASNHSPKRRRRIQSVNLEEPSNKVHLQLCMTMFAEKPEINQDDDSKHSKEENDDDLNNIPISNRKKIKMKDEGYDNENSSTDEEELPKRYEFVKSKIPTITDINLSEELIPYIALKEERKKLAIKIVELKLLKEDRTPLYTIKSKTSHDQDKLMFVNAGNEAHISGDHDFVVKTNKYRTIFELHEKNKEGKLMSTMQIKGEVSQSHCGMHFVINDKEHETEILEGFFSTLSIPFGQVRYDLVHIPSAKILVSILIVEKNMVYINASKSFPPEYILPIVTGIFQYNIILPKIVYQ